VNLGPARILDALRRAGGQTCSGETFSSRFGISRAQVWKHVETLRAHGYTIDGDPGDGYRLSEIPDRLYAEEIQIGLETSWLATEIHYFETVDSTNRVALDLARSGSSHGTTVVADQQTAGRGRLGRAFFSPPAVNLYTSIVLRPRIHTAEAPSWIFAAAVSVAQAIEQTLDEPGKAEIKWPNDVLLGGLKTSGILMELGAEATRVDFLVLGIGVNLNVDRKQFPDEFRHNATSLATHGGRPVDRLAFARRLYGNLEVNLDLCADRGFEGVRAEFDARFQMRGKRISVLELDGAELRGTALGIDDDGALSLRPETGDIIRVIAGDVTLAKENH
jgi:BirA family biotin operon repressor/biotin-[acetyl-CoA-carboxylase] ligase